MQNQQAQKKIFFCLKISSANSKKLYSFHINVSLFVKAKLFSEFTRMINDNALWKTHVLNFYSRNWIYEFINQNNNLYWIKWCNMHHRCVSLSFKHWCTITFRPTCRLMHMQYWPVFIYIYIFSLCWSIFCYK